MEEAAATFQVFNPQPFESIWKIHDDLIAISGWGIENAYQCATQWARRVDEIVNLGIAGSLNDHYPLSSLHQVNEVGNEESDRIRLQNEGLRLFSSKIPVHDEILRNQLKLNWDLVDMEGYGVAQAAREHHISVKLYKLVSDLAKLETKHLIKQNLVKHSYDLLKVVKNESCLLKDM